MSGEARARTLETEFAIPTNSQLGAFYVEGVRTHLYERFVEVDEAALSCQNSYRCSTRWTYILAAAGGSIGAFASCPDRASGIYSWAILFYIVEAATIAAVIVLGYRNWAKSSLDNWLESRHSAEVLRSKTYLAIAGLKQAQEIPHRFRNSGNEHSVKVVQAIDDFREYMHGRQDNSGEAGLRQSLSLVVSTSERGEGNTETTYSESIMVTECSGQEAASGSVRTAANYLQRAWLRDQIRYHMSKAERCMKRHEKLELFSLALFALGATLALLFVFPESMAFGEASEWKSLLESAKNTLPAIALAILGFSRTRQLHLEAHRSENTVRDLTELDEALDKVESIEELENLAGQIERAVLGELAQWQSSTRSNQSNLPA